jgi:predicted nucleic-acid-binding protein
MIALDTNVLVRAIVTESEADAATLVQQRDARTLLGSAAELFVPLTVVQELEWVLRSAYDMPAGDVANLFDDLLAVDNITVDRAAVVAEAIRGYRRGLDFSDALHIALSTTCGSLASFDSRFVKKSRRLASRPPVESPAVLLAQPRPS